ncbi:hypothetical protein CR513_03638, partial [Mucuna pruriens]
MFKRVEINVLLLNEIKQIPKYAKFLKELCIHKRKKLKGGIEMGGVVLALIKHEDVTTGLHKSCQRNVKTSVFSLFHAPLAIVPLNAMLYLRASINVIPSSIYKSLNFGDLEPTGMIIQLANRSIVQPLGILKDVLVQVNNLIFPTDFYMLDMEDKTSGKGSSLILGRPFLMIVRTKIDVHVKALLMEFEDNLVQFNIFEAMKHPTKDHSLFSIDIIDELVEEYMPIGTGSAIFSNFVEIHDLKPLPDHLKYAYLDDHQHFPIIIANNLYQGAREEVVDSGQVVPKKSEMTVMKNRHDKMVPTRIQNKLRVYANSHRYMQIHIALVDQHKTTFTCPFSIFAYTRMSFGLCNALSTFQRCMISIFSNLLEDCMEVFMNDFTVYAESFDACLKNLS